MSKSSSAGASNGSVKGGGPPPPTGSRDHLKIERDGNLVNRSVAPELPSRPHSSEFSYVVFVAPPSLQQLKRWKMENLEQVDDDELEEIIERAREMEERYGHYFDMIIIYSDPDRAYQQLLEEINLLEREPQWVPAAWLRKENQGFY